MNDFLLGIKINTIVFSKLSKVKYYYTKTTSDNTSWSHNAIRES